MTRKTVMDESRGLSERMMKMESQKQEHTAERKVSKVQLGVRVEETKKEDLDDYCRRHGIKQAEALSKAINLLTLDGVKRKAVNQAAEIEDFELHINQLLVAYKTSIMRAIDARDLAKADLQVELTCLTSLSQENEKIKKEAEKLRESNAELRQKYNELKDAFERVTKELNDTKVDRADVVELKARLAQKTEEIAQIKSQYAERLEEVQNKQYDRILALFDKIKHE